MAVYKCSDVAAATKTSAKTSSLRPRSQTPSNQHGHHPLHPRRTSGLPNENDTNVHIATINLNRDRFNNVLSALSSVSPSKRVTPPESPTGPEAELDNAPPQHTLDLEEPPHERPQERSGSTVRIDATPMSVAPAKPMQEGQEAATLSPAEGAQLGCPRRPILRNNKTAQQHGHTGTHPHGAADGREDGVVHNKANKLLKVVEGGHVVYGYHVKDFSGLFPVWPIIELALTPTGQTMDEKMTQFVRCISSLFGKILLVDEKAAIAPIAISNDNPEDMISDKVNIPSSYTKLSRWVMLSGGSWVFNKKERGKSNDMYARFHLKSRVPAEDMVSRVSFEFLQMGGTRVYKKQHQAMETETPVMLLFVSNGTNPKSIANNITQMLDTAFDDIDQEGMLPKEFEHKDIPKFTLKLNAPRLPSQTREAHKAYNHVKEQGKKAFHCKVAKEDVPFFRFLAGHAHCLKLDVKYFGKFAKFTSTLENNAPLSNCTRLRRCMQGHLNFHLSSTSLTIHGIDNLDALEALCNSTGRKRIVKVSLRDMLYRIQLESGSPLFLQLSQRPSGEVDAVIPNTPEAEMKAERINHNVAAWCINYWKDNNPGGASFFKKLAGKAFCQVQLHEVSKCTWDSATQTVTSPHAQSDMEAVVEFKNQDWVQDFLKGTPIPGATKPHMDPNVAFPFQNDFSVGTIHGANIRPTNGATQPASDTQGNNAGVIKILDDKDDDDMSVLTSKTQDKLVALLVKTRKQLSSASIGSRVASGSDNPPGSGLAATLSCSDAGRLESTPATSAPVGVGGHSIGGEARSRPSGK
jgi:hypothetical protein